MSLPRAGSEWVVLSFPQPRAAWTPCTFSPYSSDAYQLPRPCGVRSITFQIGFNSSELVYLLTRTSADFRTTARKFIFVGINPRSGCQHKAWGGAQRNPRNPN